MSAALIHSGSQELKIRIRNDSAADVAQIHRVTELAFRDAPHTDYTEQFIVDALRRSQPLTISKVAESNGKIVAHATTPPVNLSAFRVFRGKKSLKCRND
jgi:putative acetyltransferase